jgi:hypothetical protein
MYVHNVCIYARINQYSWIAWSLKTEPIGRPVMLMTNYISTLRKVPEERRYHSQAEAWYHAMHYCSSYPLFEANGYSRHHNSETEALPQERQPSEITGHNVQIRIVLYEYFLPTRHAEAKLILKNRVYVSLGDLVQTSNLTPHLRIQQQHLTQDWHILRDDINRKHLWDTVRST